MVGEVVMEILIPMLMAYLIDSGVEKGDAHDLHHRRRNGRDGKLSLACGVLSGKYGARASSGFAHNLRQSMFRNIQTFFFPTSTNTHGRARHPHDDGCDKPAERLSDDPSYVYPRTCDAAVRNGGPRSPSARGCP